MQRFLYFAILFFLSCSPIKYHTLYEGGFDPMYDFEKAKTVGFVPFCWTSWARNAGCDELFEKQLFMYAKKELERRKFEVFYISPEFLEEDSIQKAVYIKSDYERMPDLTLTVFYYQGLGDVVQVPGQAYGGLTWGEAYGGGYYGQTQSYEVQTCFLALAFTLWSGPPKYMNKAWQGVVKKGSPKPNLHERAKMMTNSVFLRKFGY